MESIYDRTFYGIYYHKGFEKSGVKLWAKRQNVRFTPYENLLLKVKLLKEYKDKRNVLCIKFLGAEDSEYELLEEPAMYYDEERWQTTPYREIPKAFIKLCKNLGIDLEKELNFNECEV